MESTSGGNLSIINKNESKKRVDEDNYKMDYMTNLPHPILLLIFSLFPYKQWVLMSPVSKYIKNLWIYAPVINFEAPKSWYTGHMTITVVVHFMVTFFLMTTVYTTLTYQETDLVNLWAESSVTLRIYNRGFPACFQLLSPFLGSANV